MVFCVRVFVCSNQEAPKPLLSDNLQSIFQLSDPESFSRTDKWEAGEGRTVHNDCNGVNGLISNYVFDITSHLWYAFYIITYPDTVSMIIKPSSVFIRLAV